MNNNIRKEWMIMERELKVDLSLYIEIDEDTTDGVAIANVEKQLAEILCGSHAGWQVHDVKVQPV